MFACFCLIQCPFFYQHTKTGYEWSDRCLLNVSCSFYTSGSAITALMSFCVFLLCRDWFSCRSFNSENRRCQLCGNHHKRHGKQVKERYGDSALSPLSVAPVVCSGQLGSDTGWRSEQPFSAGHWYQTHFTLWTKNSHVIIVEQWNSTFCQCKET